jgi:hypothetical protein
MRISGVWCLSRGLARASVKYKSVLAEADATRRGDLDGRGVLSEKRLIDFCEFMLDKALDQVKYISSLLVLQGMRERIEKYVQARNDGRVYQFTPLGSADSPANGIVPLKIEAANVLYNAFVDSSISRERAISSCQGMADRTARRLLQQLKEEGLLSETLSRSNLTWEIPEHAEPWNFPELAPGVG